MAIYVIKEAEAGQKLLRFLERFSGLPRPLLHKLLRTGQVRLNKGRVSGAEQLSAGDEIRLPPQLAGEIHLENKDGASLGKSREKSREQLDLEIDPHLKIIHLDDNFLVLVKSPGLPAQPGSKHELSASGILSAVFSGHEYVPAPAHRLDKDAGGIIVAGMNYAAQRYLHDLFREGKQDLERVYLAWVAGEWELPPLTLLQDFLCLEEDSAGREKMRTLPPDAVAGPDGRKAKILPAKAVFTCLKQTDLEGGQKASLLEVRLLTGRKHQIRVQCAARGHPIIGDRRYGGPRHPQMLLHAAKIKIPERHGLTAGLEFLSFPDWRGGFHIEKNTGI